VRLHRGSAARSLVCAEREERARIGEQGEEEEAASEGSANWTTEPKGCPPAEEEVESTPVFAAASKVRASSASEGRGSAAWASAKRAKGSVEEAGVEEGEEEAEAATTTETTLRRRCW
jgi:hypothetical protein